MRRALPMTSENIPPGMVSYSRLRGSVVAAGVASGAAAGGASPHPAQIRG